MPLFILLIWTVLVIKREVFAKTLPRTFEAQFRKNVATFSLDEKYIYSGISIRRTYDKAEVSLKWILLQRTDGFLVNFSQSSLYKADSYKALKR